MPHIHEKIDFCVAAYIVHDDKVLLIHHKGLNTWLPIGGHVELDEDTDHALFREIEEECGLKEHQLTVLTTRPQFLGSKSRPLLTPNYMDIHPIKDGHEHIGMVFFAHSTSKNITLAEQEHNDIRWFTEAELNDSTFGVRSDVTWYAKEAFRTVRISQPSH